MEGCGVCECRMGWGERAGVSELGESAEVGWCGAEYTLRFWLGTMVRGAAGWGPEEMHRTQWKERNTPEQM